MTHLINIKNLSLYFLFRLRNFYSHVSGKCKNFWCCCFVWRIQLIYGFSTQFMKSEVRNLLRKYAFEFTCEIIFIIIIMLSFDLRLLKKACFIVSCYMLVPFLTINLEPCLSCHVMILSQIAAVCCVHTTFKLF